MKKKIIIAIAIITIFIANNFFWFGKLIDIGLTLETRNQQLYEAESSFSELKEICLYIGPNTTKEELMLLLKRQFREDEIFQKNGSVYSSWLGFNFKDDKLYEVTTTVEYNPDSEG